MARSSLPCRSSFSAFLIVSARSMAKGPSDPIKQRRWPERAAVRVGVAEFRDGIEVVAGGVALVAGQTLARDLPPPLPHAAGARPLCGDRGRRTLRAPRVAA